MGFRRLIRLMAALVLLFGGRVYAAYESVDTLVPSIESLFDRHGAIMLLIDPDDGSILAANEAAAAFYGYSPAELESMRVQDINTLSEDQVRSEMLLARAQARNYFVFRHRLASGELRTVEVRSSPIFWAGRDSLLSIVTDVSDHAETAGAIARQQDLLESIIASQTDEIERKALVTELALAAIAIAAIVVACFLWFSRRSIRKAEALASQEHDRLEDLVRATGIGTWEWHIASGEIHVNDRFESLIGRSSGQSHLTRIEELGALTHEDDLDGMQTALIEHLKGKTAYLEYESRIAHTDGHWLWIRTRGSVMRRDEQGRAIMLAGFIREVTQEKSSEDHLFRLANYDTLTGLPNRAALLERLRLSMVQAKRSGRPLALAFIDLDDFKPVNDRYGHDVGDELLIGVAKRMLGALRDSDTLARIGGDEFVAILTEIGDESVNMSLYQRILSAASEPVTIRGDRISLGASIGITVYPQSETLEADQLLRQADQAMYEAKNSGKNRIRRFDLDKLQEATDRRAARLEIRRAIEANELLLHYQPKVNLTSGRLVGAEALVRWQHPKRGLLQPGDFLPKLEGADDATRLGEWVIRRALSQCNAWHEGGLHCPVSVNIDVLQFKRADFTTRLAAFLGEFPHLPPNSLELEILETGALEQDVVANGTLRRCRDMGVRISLDDFGTGFSSLSYLKSVPADCLKIDRSFVMSMLSDPYDLSIIKGVLGLAAAFNRESIAEGVSTEDHGTMLLRLGCTVGQGYAIAQPMPGDLLRDWLYTWKPPAVWKRTLRLPREEHLILYALVELRSWSGQINAYLDGAATQPPAFAAQTGLGSWLQGDGAKALRNEPEVYQLHRCQEFLVKLIEELAAKPMPRPSTDIYRDLVAVTDEGHDVIEQLLQRDALNHVSGHLRLVSSR